ncbi:MAG: DUF4142 domain-containing protein [Gemmatimonadota bacterium]
MFSLRMVFSLLLGSTLALAPARAFAQSQSGSGGKQEPSHAPTLSDPEIAHIAVTANAIDVDLAKLAKARAKDAKVLRFAQTMVDDHTAVNARAGALAEKLGVTPQDNAVSQQLQKGAETARGELETLSGAKFDRAYIEREVAYHEAVLDALDRTLIPGATNAELRTLLVEVRPVIAAHLKVAESIAETL